jgi:hypothetical protein
VTGEEMIAVFNAVALRDQGRPLSLTLMKHLGLSAEDAQLVYLHVLDAAGGPVGITKASTKAEVQVFTEGLVAGLRLAKAARS